MSFRPTEEQQVAIDSLRRFLDNEIEPKISDYLEEDRLIPTPLMKEILGSLSEFGLIRAPHSEEFGGLGLDWVTHLLLFEEVVYTSVNIAVPILINVGAVSSLFGMPAHIRDRYLSGAMSGQVIISAGISEPNVGSDVAGIETTAKPDGDDYVLNGEKTWISNGEYSDILLCTARTSGEEGGKLSQFLVDREEHGYEVRGIPKIAMNSQSTAQIFLDDVRVPAENMLGGKGTGLKATLKGFERARIHMAAWGYGIARRALAESIKYSQDRKQHGKPIAGHQLIAAKIATMATEVDAARLLALRAAEMIDSGLRCDKECSMAKWYGTELAVRAGRDAVQIHGGNGVTREYIVERLAREGLIAPIPDGTTEIQKLIIARSLTGISAIK
jgi:alkylation response protein AidB-like acyl-CoA dehydrogenase